MNYESSNVPIPKTQKIIVSWLVPILLIGASIVIAWFTTSALSPYTRFITIDLYRREHLLLATLFVSTVGMSWILGKIIRLKPEIIRRTVFTAAVITSIPIIMWISHEPALNRGAQRKTMRDIRTISKSIELFHSKNGGYPVANDINSLQAVLRSDIPKFDGWQTPFYVFSTNEGYTIQSFGADGVPDAQQPDGMTMMFAADIVFKNGTFIAYPEGVER